MIRRAKTVWTLGFVFLLTSFLISDVSLACAVCYGDSESPMAKGVVAGVAVLVGFISFVLVGVLGFGLFFRHRSKHIAQFGEYASHDDFLHDDAPHKDDSRNDEPS